MYTDGKAHKLFVQVQQLCEHFQLHSAPEKSTIISAEKQLDYLIFLNTGLAGMQTLTQEGDRIIISLFGAGSLFPLSRLLLETPNQNDFVALNNSTYQKIPISVCKNWMQEHVFFREYVIWCLANRHQNLIKQLTAFKQNDATTKIAAILEQLSSFELLGQDAPNTHHLSQQDIADLAGVSRETVSRYSGQMKSHH